MVYKQKEIYVIILIYKQIVRYLEKSNKKREVDVMENKKSQIMKRVAMFVMAFVMVLTTVLVPAPVKAADQSNGFIVASYTMVKGEKWNLVVHNVDNKAKPTYKTNKKAVATVNKKGVVTAKKPGNAVITVTWKEGKDTYQAKAKIKVKKSITYAEAIKRVNTELNLLYDYACYFAETNGWLDNDEAVEYLNACAEAVNDANTVVADVNSYSDEDIAAVLEEIEAMVTTMDKVLPYLTQPNA